jgi:hypothetical protein
MPAPTIYRSSDASAPVLSGTVGALVALLDACLVTGYGSKTAAGWTKPYTGTNAATFRQGGGTQSYLEVLDNGPGTAGAKETRLGGWEIATAHTVGTNRFPAAATSSTFVKSTTADATARAWVLIGDNIGFFLFVKNGIDAGSYVAMHFGDVISVKSPDPYKAALICKNTENQASFNAETFAAFASSGTTTQGAHVLCRNHNGATLASPFGKIGDTGRAQTSGIFNGTIPFPNGGDNAIYVSPVWVHDVSGNVRGRVRGLYHGLHNLGAMGDGDTFSGAGDYAGKTFVVVANIGAGVVGVGYVVIETTAWDTSA